MANAGSYKLEVWGATGGCGSGNNRGSYGGYSVGTINLDAGSILYISVGENAANISDSGGSSKGSCGDRSTRTFGGGGLGDGPGGGATDIRVGQNSLYARVIVAGGGGGANYNDSSNRTTGYGGGYTGGSPTFNEANNQSISGGTQTSGGNGHNRGSFGYGGNGLDSASQYGGAGGGGGWYGGGGSTTYQTGAGGGSGYIYNASSSSSYPAGGLLDSKYYLTNGAMYMYNHNCLSSSNVGTKTICTSILSHSAASNQILEGDGYARITRQS